MAAAQFANFEPAGNVVGNVRPARLRGADGQIMPGVFFADKQQVFSGGAHVGKAYQLRVFGQQGV